MRATEAGDRPLVVLINPRACSPRSVRLPLSLLSLAAVLEGRFDYAILDGNLLPDVTARAVALLKGRPKALVGLTVMPGPQMVESIEVSKGIRAAFPEVPIVWGGYFPSLYPDAAIHADYVDYVVRGQGEDTLLELLGCWTDGGSPDRRPPDRRPPDRRPPDTLAAIAGLTYRVDGRPVHNRDRAFKPVGAYPPLPYHCLGDLEPYLRPTFMGSRTGVYQAAVGCRYRCEFCGVVSMFNGTTRLATEDRLLYEATVQRDTYGVDALQFYDHNFFDTEASSRPLLEVLGRVGLPWWCYARADTLAGFSASTWGLIRKSRLTMAYIGAESASDDVLKSMRKGSRVEHTFEVARRCLENGVIPEFSFVLGGPEDPEGEIERTFAFIKKLKAVHPACEVILYFYTPTPRREAATPDNRALGRRLPTMDHHLELPMPTSPEEWAEPKWVDFVCHRFTPWLSDKMHRRVQDFATVLGCRFPTVQDAALPPWGRKVLQGAASWRYATGFYSRPYELRFLKQRLRLREPQRESL